MLLAFMACSNNDEVVDDLANTIGVFVPDMILEDGDTIIESRSSLVKDGTNMRFSWDSNDVIGVFSVLNKDGNQFTEIGPQESENTAFYYKPGYDETVGTGMRSRFHNGQYSFDQDHYWIAYSPYECNYVGGERRKVFHYDQICLSYEGQCQLVNAKGAEKEGAAHLGAYDYLISAKAQPNDDNMTNFTFSHIGATVRFYMRFPTGALGGAGKQAIVKELAVIDETGETPFVSEANIAISPSAGTDAPYTVTSTTKSQTMKLYFGNNREGITVNDHDYLTAYMQVFPTEVEEKTCRLYVTVEVDGIKKFFKSLDFLDKKTITAGVFTQWTTSSFYDPIELVTATLVPWEDLNGGEINTGE